MNINKLELSKELQQTLSNKLKLSNLTLEKYLSSLVKKDLECNILLSNEYFFDYYADKLYKENYTNEIILTKTQLNIVRILIEVRGGVLSNDDLREKCFSLKKDASIFTLRNMIKQIRDKTYYDFIKSHSKKGYSIDYPLNCQTKNKISHL